MVDRGWRAEREMRVRSALDKAERSGGVGKGKFTTCKSESVLEEMILTVNTEEAVKSTSLSPFLHFVNRIDQLLKGQSVIRDRNGVKACLFILTTPLRR